MRSATWFVLFPSSRGPDLDAVARTLKLLSRCILDHVEDFHWELYCGRSQIRIELNVAVEVARDSRLLVELHGGRLPDPALIATYDARFELTYDADQRAEVYNPLHIAAERLARLTGGIVYGDGAFLA